MVELEPRVPLKARGFLLTAAHLPSSPTCPILPPPPAQNRHHVQVPVTQKNLVKVSQQGPRPSAVDWPRLGKLAPRALGREAILLQT